MFKEVKAQLAGLHTEGGITIITADATRADTPAGTGAPPLARTLIQPDGDVITTISRRVLVEQGLWDRHLKNVRRRLHLLSSVRRAVRGLQFAGVVLALHGISQLQRGRMNLAAASVLAGVALFLIRPALVFWLRTAVGAPGRPPAR